MAREDVRPEPELEAAWGDEPDPPIVAVVAHDDALVSEIVARACTGRGIEVIGAEDSMEGLLQALRRHRPAVVLLGNTVGGRSVDDVLPEVTVLDVKVIVVSHEANPERMTALLSRGASGYLLYDSAPDEIAIGVQAVARGAAAINHTVAAQLIRQWRMLHSGSLSAGGPTNRVLTPREREVLAAMAEGLPTKAIAKRLGVAVKTVENHKVRVFEKLNVRTHAQAVTVALTYGLVADPPMVQSGTHG